MPKSIRAAVCRSPKAAPSIEDIVIDDPRADEMLIALRAVGVCHTDIVMRDQLVPIPQPVVLGHEGSGIVEAVGAGVQGFAPGDHVVLSFDSCGECGACHEDQPAYCQTWVPLNFGAARADGSSALSGADGERIHGHIFGQSAFATHAIVKARNAVKVDPDLPLELLGPLGCGIQTGAGTILNVLKPRRGSALAVIGTGAVGMSAIMAAAIEGPTIIAAIDRDADRIKFALENGATHGFVAGPDILELAKECGAPQGFDYIIDTTGSPKVVTSAIQALAMRGELALLATYPPGGIELDLFHVMTGGRVVRGIVEGASDPQSFIPQLAALYRDGRFPFDRMVTFFDFDQIAAAIEAGESGRVLKPIVRMP